MTDNLTIKDNSLSKIIQLISNCMLGLCAISFLSLYLILSFFNRPSSDDILFISILKDKSLFDYIHWFYLTWSGRWASNGYFYSIMLETKSFGDIHYYTFLYHCFTLLILLYSLYTIIRWGIKKLFAVQLNTLTVLTYSILFIACFYFFTFNHIEVWWWFCASVDTLQGIVFLLLGIAFLLKENKSIHHYIVISFCFIYVGGGFEIYSLIIGFILFVLIVAGIIKKQNSFAKRFILPFLSLAIAASVSFVAPGNMKRKNYALLDNIETARTSNGTDSSFIDPTFLLQKKHMLAFGLAALWLILGMKLKTKTKEGINKQSLKTTLLVSLAVFIISIIITWIFQLIILNGSGIPARGWTFTSFTFSVFICIAFLSAGYYLASTNNFFKILFAVTVPSLLLIMLLFTTVKQYNYASRYANSYDELIAILINSKNNSSDQPILVKELPDAGMLLTMDIADSSITVPLKEILGINNEIRVVK